MKNPRHIPLNESRNHLPTKVINGTPLIDNYEELFQSFRNMVDEEDQIFKFLSEKLSQLQVQNTLDVGAGDGKLSSRLLSLSKTVTALEPNHTLACQIPTNPNLSIRENSLQNFEIGELFDVIVISHVIEAIPSYQRLFSLKKLADMLSADGRMYIVHNSPYSNFNMIFSDSFDHHRIIKNRIRSIRQHLKLSGFLYFEHELDTKATYRDYEDFLKFILFYTEMKETQIQNRQMKIQDFYSSLASEKDFKFLSGKIRIFEAWKAR